MESDRIYKRGHGQSGAFTRILRFPFQRRGGHQRRGWLHSDFKIPISEWAACYRHGDCAHPAVSQFDRSACKCCIACRFLVVASPQEDRSRNSRDCRCSDPSKVQCIHAARFRSALLGCIAWIVEADDIPGSPTGLACLQFCLVVATLETDPDGSRYCVATLCHRVLLHVGHVRTSPWACVSVTLQWSETNAPVGASNCEDQTKALAVQLNFLDADMISCDKL